ncbi:MAG: histidine phosphatase family protein [Verrucomicrobia bacterium]|nr:histidine phosphatase family protein [Verrucomicrobiota bacterium]
MKLTLLRHGTAEGEPPAGRDALRELVDRGRRESRNAGWYYRQRRGVPDLVLHSPYRRTTETARLFCEEGGFAPPVEAEFLASGMWVEQALGGLAPYLGLGRVVIVGHQPDLGMLLGYLVGKADADFEVGKGSLHEMELDRLEEGAGRLIYAMTAPEIASERSRA